MLRSSYPTAAGATDMRQLPARLVRLDVQETGFPSAEEIGNRRDRRNREKYPLTSTPYQTIRKEQPRSGIPQRLSRASACEVPYEVDETLIRAWVDGIAALRTRWEIAPRNFR
jgi:hypothetical protein